MSMDGVGVTNKVWLPGVDILYGAGLCTKERYQDGSIVNA